MSVIVSETMLLKDMPSGWWPTSTNSSMLLYNGFSFDYAALYKAQPNIRTCVDFLARNIAQLGIHVYKTDDKQGRIRLRDHPLAILLGRPLPNQMKFTRYRLVESIVCDMGIYGNAFLKKEINDDGKIIGLLRLPPTQVTVKGALVPTKYELNLGYGRPKAYDPDEIVHFRVYNSESNIVGLSPLETLRRILAEEHAAGDYRENYWLNAARMSGVLSTEQRLSEPAIDRLRNQWSELYSGSDNSGKTAILEEGLEFKQVSFNPKDSEYLDGRKLTREECARAYHIPPPLVGILDHATYSNIEQQHKSLYIDVLGTWTAMLEDDLKLQLMDDFEDSDGVYPEFNIQEKMQGDFETQMKSLQSATGTPWMTVNEARSIMNLPYVEGGDEMVVPLNVLIGGQASPTDSAPKDFAEYLMRDYLMRYFANYLGEKGMMDVSVDASTPTSHDAGALQKSLLESFETREPELRQIYDEKWRSLLVRTFERQRNAVLPAVKSQDIQTVWDLDRWNSELTADFTTLSLQTAMAWAEALAKKMGDVTITEDMLRKFIEENARIAAEYLNESIQEQIEVALADEDDPKEAVRRGFEALMTVTVIRFAIGRVTGLASYGGYQAALRGRVISKTWVVNSTNPRDSHSAMNGETVGIRDRFSNGMRWPGDYEGSARETVNCECSLRYNREFE